MKKSLIVLASLALTGALAFGQDAAPTLKFGGYLDTGLKLTNTSAGNVAYIGGDDSGQALGSMELSGAYAMKTSGVNFKFRFQPASSPAVLLENAYYWVTPIDNLKLLFGNIDGSNYSAIDDNGTNPGGSDGAQVQYAMSGFAAGAQLHVDKTNAVHYSAGAGYTADKLAQAVFNLSTNTESKVDTYSVSASLLAVPGLTLKGGYYVSGVASTAVNTADATLGYAITPALSAQAVVYDYLSGTTYYKVNPSVSYTVSPALSAGAGYTYYTDLKANDINLNATYHFDSAAQVIVNADIADASHGNTATNTVKADFRYSF